MPTRKCEITMRFVTTLEGAKVSSIIDAVSGLADDVTISCKVLDRPEERVAAKRRNTRTPPDRASPFDEEAEKSDRPQLAYTADLGANHRRYIDVEASLKKLGLTKDQLVSRTWPRGSPQHRLKRAAATYPTNGSAAIR